MTAPRVFLHGWGLGGAVWAESGLAGVTPDLPGYGDTPSVHPYTAENLADAVAETIETPVQLIGWSMGGMLALALAARHPDKVTRLVLVGTSPAFVSRPDWPHALAPEVLADFAASLRRDARATLLRFLGLQAHGGEAVREVIGRLRACLFRRRLPAVEVLAAGLDLLREVDLRTHATAVRCPTLVVHGVHDGLCPAPAGRWLAAHIPGARLAMHADAAHVPFLSHPRWFAGQVGGFLHA